MQKGLKHPVKTNENIAIGLFKERMVKIILEGDHYRQALMLSSSRRIWKSMLCQKGKCQGGNVRETKQTNTV